MIRTHKFRPNGWGKLEQFQVPCQIVTDNVLSLTPRAIATLMFLYFKAKGRYRQLARYSSPRENNYINVIASQKDLSLKTGYSRNILTAAAAELVDLGWLEAPAQRRFKRGELATNEYFLLDPKTRQRLTKTPVFPYFTVPACIIRKDEMHWSLRSLSPPEIALYTCMLFRAYEERKNKFKNNPILLRKMSKLSRGTKGTFSKAMESLQEKGLIVVEEDSITLCDPLTGEPPVFVVDAVDDPAYYYDSSDGKRITLNLGNPEALLKWVEDSLPDGECMIQESNGEYKIKCPFHADRNPSLNFNPSKNTFHCLTVAHS